MHVFIHVYKIACIGYNQVCIIYHTHTPSTMLYIYISIIYRFNVFSTKALHAAALYPKASTRFVGNIDQLSRIGLLVPGRRHPSGRHPIRLATLWWRRPIRLTLRRHSVGWRPNCRPRRREGWRSCTTTYNEGVARLSGVVITWQDEICHVYR